VVKLVELELGFISRLVGQAAKVSDLSAVTYPLTTSGMSGLVVPEPSSQIADIWKDEFPPGYLFPVPVGILFPVALLHLG